MMFFCTQSAFQDSYPNAASVLRFKQTFLVQGTLTSLQKTKWSKRSQFLISDAIMKYYENKTNKKWLACYN